MSPEQTMNLTVSQISCLLPDEVEDAVANAEAAPVRNQQVEGAIELLKKENPDRTSFSQSEVEGTIWRVYGRRKQ